MPYSRFGASVSSPKVDVFVDMGNPYLNLSLDGFLKIGTVAASKVAAEESYHCIKKGFISFSLVSSLASVMGTPDRSDSSGISYRTASPPERLPRLSAEASPPDPNISSKSETRAAPKSIATKGTNSLHLHHATVFSTASEPGSVSKHSLENSLKKMCKEGAYWGSVAGLYVGMEYGMERVRGTRDWKNAMLGGALTGAIVSAATSNSRDKVVVDAITGGAIATAAEFLNYLT